MDDGTAPPNFAGLFGAALDAHRYADALIAIVSRQWPQTCHGECCEHSGRVCDLCGGSLDLADHAEECPWLTAARALGIA